MSNELEKLARGTLLLKEKYDSSLQEIDRLEGELGSLNKRAQAERILILAQKTNTNLRVSDVEEFMAKRAELESKSLEELEKIANYITFSAEGDGDIILSDYSGESDENFVDWLRSQAATNY